MAKVNNKKEVKQTPKGPPLELPAGTTEEIDPRRLLLDPQNLRLLERTDDPLKDVDVSLVGQDSVQRRLFESLWDDELFDVKSLSTSISNIGFLRHERLIVAKYDGENFLVLEGNRRLTAVLQIFNSNGTDLRGLRKDVRDSLATLPCFVLDGPAISGSKEQLNTYRRAAEIYIGLRHIGGAREWEPASRYEFEARLVFDEGWTIDQIAEAFGRKPNEVTRDLKAQKLYHAYLAFEQRHGFSHSLTYNAFNEAARSPDIMKWLGWSDKSLRMNKQEQVDAFFFYLTTKIRVPTSLPGFEDDGPSPRKSTEAAVRKLRDLLKLKDNDVEDALMARQFDEAELLFEQKREGNFGKRVETFTRSLGRVTTKELGDDLQENKRRLTALVADANKVIKIIDAKRKSVASGMTTTKI